MPKTRKPSVIRIEVCLDDYRIDRDRIEPIVKDVARHVANIIKGRRHGVHIERKPPDRITNPDGLIDVIILTPIV